MCNEYNGWTNRETWATALWIDNTEGLYNEAQAMAREYIKQRDENSIAHESWLFAQYADGLENWVSELLDMEEVLSAEPAQRKELILMSSDIGSLYRVNWREIAESYISEIKLQEAN
jgi:hypothetical protein